MNKSVAIIVGGTGQFGRILTKKLIKKNYKVVVTTRSLSKAKLKVKSNKSLLLKKLNILKKKDIKFLILKFKPKIIIFLAGQSSPKKSFFKKKETYLSNFVGCKNFLEVILKHKIPCKFLNSSSCEIYGNIKKKIGLKTKKKSYKPLWVCKIKILQNYKKI